LKSTFRGKRFRGTYAKTFASEANQKGEFKLFALFLRDGSPGKWDVLVSAKWIDANKQQALKIITEQLTTKQELISLSRVVVINQDNEALSAINQFMPVRKLLKYMIRIFFV